MNEQTLMQKILREGLEKRVRENENYSLRAFAKKLHVSPSTLSEFLKGKRKLSAKLIQRISKEIEMSANDKEALYDGLYQSLIGKKSPQEIEMHFIENEKGYLIEDWLFYGVLSFMETNRFKNDLSWMADELNRSEDKIKEVIEVLIKHGLLEESAEGYRPIDKVLSTTEDIVNYSLRKRYRNNFKDAEKAISKVPVDKRDFSFMTVALNKNKIVEVKELVRKLYDDIERLHHDDDKTDVYEINIQLFPRTKGALQ